MGVEVLSLLGSTPMTKFSCHMYGMNTWKINGIAGIT